MFIRQLYHSDSCSYTYLLVDEKVRQSIIIDPVQDSVASYLQLLRELDVELLYAIDTHLHADHVTGMGFLREATGCKTLVGAPSPITCATQHVEDGGVICCGSLRLKAIHTPGHTADSYSFYLEGSPGYVFTGDTLLIRGTGRTDLPGGSTEALYESLFQRLLCLPDETVVFPGHDYKGFTQSTIMQERQHNPRLQVKDWHALAEILDNLNLGLPKMLEVALPANRNCGVALVS